MAQAKGLSGVAKLKVMEPGFSEADFLDGARAAYGYFYQSWNARDEEGLDNLCAPTLFGRLMNELHDDATYAPVEVDEIVDARIGDVRVHGQTAIVSVDFEAVQREGDGVAKTVKSKWVLARPLGSEDPNWELQDIVVRSDA
jgi:predicted lipid-binding transport protein (Tim44 family)